MTNKVKPFYIRITDDMTAQMVQDVFDKCRKLGVKDTELCNSLDYSHWFYFGVCGRDGLYHSDYHDNFHGDAQEITLGQLDEWLGLEVDKEWKDTDDLPPAGSKVMTSFTESDCDNWCDFHGPSEIIAYHGDYVWVAHHGRFNRVHALSDIEFEKPETPEQKAERERLEAAYDLYLARLSISEDYAPYTYGEFLGEKSTKLGFLAIVDKTGYRKQ